MCRDTLYLGKPLSLDFFNNGFKGIFIKPIRMLLPYRNRWKFFNFFGRQEISKYSRFAETGLSIFSNLNCKESFMNNVTNAINYTCTVKVKSCRNIVLK